MNTATHKQFNALIETNDLKALKRLCHINGLTLSGAARSLVKKLLNGEVTLDFDEIRRSDFELRNKMKL